MCVDYWASKRYLPIVSISSGFIALGIFVFVMVALQAAGLPWADLTAQLLVAAALFILFPEAVSLRAISGLVAPLLICGCALGLVWVGLFAPSGEVSFIDAKDLPTSSIVVSLVGTSLVTPIFEEKIVRGLVLKGLAPRLGPIWSSVVVSLGFALVHWQSMLWAFIASSLLCAVFFKTKMSTLCCVVVHGATNATIMTWHYTHGFETILR